jgi:hypothetical protein
MDLIEGCTHRVENTCDGDETAVAITTIEAEQTRGGI